EKGGKFPQRLYWFLDRPLRLRSTSPFKGNSHSSLGVAESHFPTFTSFF
ncbi:unnamed protein product, partial [Linum tenue]